MKKVNFVIGAAALMMSLSAAAQTTKVIQLYSCSPKISYRPGVIYTAVDVTASLPDGELKLVITKYKVKASRAMLKSVVIAPVKELEAIQSTRDEIKKDGLSTRHVMARFVSLDNNFKLTVMREELPPLDPSNSRHKAKFSMGRSLPADYICEFHAK